MFTKDLMTTNVITIGPDTPIPEIAVILSKHGISAVPVITDEESVIGIISEGDLVQTLRGRQGLRRSWWLKLIGNPDEHNHDFSQFSRDCRDTAKDAMTKEVICADYFSTDPISRGNAGEKSH